MKFSIISILLTAPFVALGQNDFDIKNVAETYITQEIGFEKQCIGKASNQLERRVETALIYDIKKESTILNYELDRAANLSLTLIDVNFSYVLDAAALDKMLLEIGTLKDF